MFGIKSSGCFVIGIMIGFLAASILAAGVYFYLNPEQKDENMEKVEKLWNSFKDNGDHCIKIIKETPVPEPSVISIRKKSDK